MAQTTGFTHLHVHTQFSLLDGLSHNDDLIALCKKHKMTSLAITDHGVMYGVLHFYNDLKKAGIKPIIGMEAYYTTGSRAEKSLEHKTHHMLLLAKNNLGYKNLMKLTSFAHLEGFYYKPRIDWELLEKYHHGLIATSACLQGEIPSLIREGNLELAETRLRAYQKLFKDDYYIELQRHENVPELEPVNKQLIKFSRKLGIALIATNDVHYADKDDAKAQDALLAVQTRTTLDDKNRMSMIDSPSYYLKSPKEMADLFQDIPEAVDNTIKLAAKCNVTIKTGKMIFPNYPLPKGYTSENLLREMVKERRANRYKKPDKETQDRIKYELDVICSKGYASYFLIVQDFVNWAKEQGIRVGPGRGSAAGSIVSYILRITSLDPIQHNLPFERFMNPERPSPPDIDIDIADVSRDRVIEYVAKKYGDDKVAQVITFGTMEARAAIRDIGRVLGMPYSEPDKVAKMIPVGYSIDESLSNVFELQEMYKDPKYKELLDLAKKVEGTARHASTHAAAVVITDKELTNYVPIQRESKNNNITTQYDMYALDLNVKPDAIGLLKMDLLGLRNLTTLQNAIKLIKETEGKDVDISSIPLDDPKVYEMLSRGDTTGVFQLESNGMRRLAKQLKPNKFADIVAMVALYRPGPMTLIPEYAKGKKNPDKVKYPHPDLKPILEETYGIAVYQEQVLQIANVMAGYSLGEADILRRAMGKKEASIMRKEKKRFIDQAQAKKYSKAVAEKVWSFVDKFAGYGFNKAHSASYAMISYQTAYLKTNYPVEYMAALMSSESGKEDKLTLSLEATRSMGIHVLPPNINTSHEDFTIERGKNSLSGKAIRFGIAAIKNVGTAAIENILKERIMAGNFKSFTDFMARVNAQKVNKKVLESLIKVGTMDAFGKRSVLLGEIERIRQMVNQSTTRKNSNQTGLFDSLIEEAEDLVQDNFVLDSDEFPQEELVQMEKDLLGIYLREHPMQKKLKVIRSATATRITDLESKKNKRVVVYGIISSIRVVMTKRNNQEMAFISISDETGQVDVVIFPQIYAKHKDICIEGNIIVIKTKVEEREDKISLIAEDLKLPDLTKTKTHDKAKKNTIIIADTTSKKTLLELNQLLQDNKGKVEVTLVFQNGHGRELDLPFGINYNQNLKNKIKQILT